MREKKLSVLLANLPFSQWRGPADQKISALVYDSRQAGPGSLFFALPGLHVDGHDFIPQAVAAGCRAVLHSQDLPSEHPETTYVRVKDTRQAMSPLAAAFFDHPSHELTVIGVTGTDGKSTTVSFIHQLLELTGHPAGFFSTVQWKTGAAVEANSFRQSTPEAPQIHGLLRLMRDNGLEFAVVESTSHGLSPLTNRLGDVRYTAAVLTNVTIEHLEFHGTLENYRRDKARLFSALDRNPNPAFGVVNLDDPHQALFSAATRRPVLGYSQKDPSADLYASRISESPDGLEFTLTADGKSVSGGLNIPGRFNIENLMAALLTVARLLGKSPLQLVPLAQKLVPVKGRMKSVRRGQDFQVLIDYAHTPGAYEKLLPAVRATTSGRLLVVFGSAGERDHEKRPLQGELADRFADIIVLTDEDPRHEGSLPIIREIAVGIKGKTWEIDLFSCTPRALAVEKAISLARSGDTVLLLGKGHEQCIIYADRQEPYDEENAAVQALAKQGWGA